MSPSSSGPVRARRDPRRRLATATLILIAAGAFVLWSWRGITRQTAAYLPDRQVVSTSMQIRTGPGPGAGVLWFYRETFYPFPDAAIATAFAIQVDPSRLTPGTTTRFVEADSSATAVSLHGPLREAFSVAGTLDVIRAAEHSIRVRVRLSRTGLPPPRFPAGTFSFDEEVEFQIEEDGDRDFHVNEWH